MARRWLDVARFAESYTLRGFVMPEAWRYRDYCIQAFNGDLPWNQFVKEQLAGDLLQSSSMEVRRREQTAVAFLLLGNNNLEEQDKDQLDMDVIDEQLETLGKAFLAKRSDVLDATITSLIHSNQRLLRSGGHFEILGRVET